VRRRIRRARRSRRRLARPSMMNCWLTRSDSHCPIKRAIMPRPGGYAGLHMSRRGPARCRADLSSGTASGAAVAISPATTNRLGRPARRRTPSRRTSALYNLRFLTPNSATLRWGTPASASASLKTGWPEPRSAPRKSALIPLGPDAFRSQPWRSLNGDLRSRFTNQ
jgi:hypothetical protein